MKEALAAQATVGEVCHALRGVWGTYVPADSLLTVRAARLRQFGRHATRVTRRRGATSRV